MGMKVDGSVANLSGPLKDYVEKTSSELLVNNGLFGLGLANYNWTIYTGFRLDILDFFGIFIEAGIPNLVAGGIHFRF